MGFLFLSAFALGLAFCAPPGAVNAEAVRRGLARGFWSAWRVQLGSLIGDATWALIALAGAALLVQNPLIQVVLGVIGAGFLLHLAGRALGDAWAGALPKPPTKALGGDFTTGAVLSLANPFAIAFWLGFGGAVVSAGATEPGPTHFAIFFVGFMLAALLWTLFISALISGGRRVLTPTFYRWVNVVCGLALGYFGLSLLWNTLQPWVS